MHRQKTRGESTEGRNCHPKPLLPVTLQQVLREAAGGETLRARLLALIMLVVLKVLDNVPHIAGFDC